MKIHANRTENRTTFRIKTRYYLVILMPETMKVCESIKSKTNNNTNGKHVLHLGITEVVIVHSNFVNIDYKPLKTVIFLKTFDSEFSYIQVCFTDQTHKPLELEDKIYIILVFN